MHDGSSIRLARAYDPPAPSDGARLLVDRLWPRGLKKSSINCDEWLRDIAPSTQLRRWYSHDDDKWDEFCRRYVVELDNNLEAVERCARWCSRGPVTLLFAARDRSRNNAVVLRDYLLRNVTTSRP